MWKRHPDPFTLVAAERLLDAAADPEPATGPASGPSDDLRLAQLLAAAARTGPDAHLPGAPEALAAFQQAQAAPPPQPVHGWRRVKAGLASILSAKLVLGAAAASAAAVTGGVALTTGTGVLPGTDPQDAQSTPSTSSVHPNPSPAPNLRGLCSAWQQATASAGSQDERNAARRPAFAALVSAAGGASRVDAFCTQLPAATPGGPPTGQPNGAPHGQPAGDRHGKPVGPPGGKPSAEPTGKPSSAPGGGRPSAPPSKQPTSAPTPRPTGAPQPPADNPASAPRPTKSPTTPPPPAAPGGAAHG